MASIKINNNLIKGKMKEQNISYSDLAELLNCSTQNLYNMLNKETVPTYTERLIFICYMLNLSPMDVFDIEE